MSVSRFFRTVLMGFLALVLLGAGLSSTTSASASSQDNTTLPPRTLVLPAARENMPYERIVISNKLRGKQVHGTYISDEDIAKLAEHNLQVTLEPAGYLHDQGLDKYSCTIETMPSKNATKPGTVVFSYLVMDKFGNSSEQYCAIQVLPTQPSATIKQQWKDANVPRGTAKFAVTKVSYNGATDESSLQKMPTVDPVSLELLMPDELKRKSVVSGNVIPKDRSFKAAGTYVYTIKATSFDPAAPLLKGERIITDHTTYELTLEVEPVLTSRQFVYVSKVTLKSKDSATPAQPNASEALFTSTFIKNKAPELEVKDAQIYKGEQIDLKNLIVKAADAEDGPNLVDNVTIDKGNFDSSKLGSHTIKYTLVDAAGVQVQKTATVTVKFKLVTLNQAPVLEVKKDASIMQGDAFDLKSLIIKAEDAEDGPNLVDNVTIDKGDFDVSKPSIYEIRYTLVDSAGITVRKKATVIVQKKKVSPASSETNKPSTVKHHAKATSQEKKLPKTSDASVPAALIAWVGFVGMTMFGLACKHK